MKTLHRATLSAPALLAALLLDLVRKAQSRHRPHAHADSDRGADARARAHRHTETDSDRYPRARAHCDACGRHASRPRGHADARAVIRPRGS